MPWIALAVLSTAVGEPDGPRDEQPPIRASRVAGPPTAKCDSCHTIDPEHSHPVDIVPSMQVPAHLPLFDGRMTCRTCHGGPHPLDGRRGHAMLRGATSGTAFCGQCHAVRSADPAALHAAAVRFAHPDLAPDMGHGSSAARPGDWGLDSQSEQCLSCHDGSVVGGGGHGPGLASRVDPVPGRGDDHPVGVLYPDSPHAISRGYTPSGQLDHRIRLFDGRVGCGSCHSVYSSRRHLLVMSNERSALCLTCHDM